MKKKAIVVIKPKLLNAMIETQNLRGINLVKGKDDCLTFNKNSPHKHTADSSTSCVYMGAV
jgi:hypothetical protein